jgi:MtN3 and saliva related transmembrane protein
MGWTEILGFVGGALTTFSYVPQLWRLYKLRSAREISLLFTVLFLLGVSCWLCYGIVLRLPAVAVWNAASLVLASGMLYAKLRYSK